MKIKSLKNNIVNIFFLFIIFYFLLICLFSFYRIYNPSQVGAISKTYYFFLITSFILIILNIYIIFLNLNKKINILIIYLSLFLSVFLIEIYLEIYKPYLPSQILTNERIKLAHQKNINFDKRSKYEIIQNISQSGKQSFLKYEPYMAVEYDGNGLKYKNKRIFPLTGISNIYTTLSNETGKYPVILTDDYGFNNNVKLKNNIDFALIGDSFTEGYSVQHNENISSFMRKNDINVYNFGVGGSGPLSQYAIFREYVQKIKPKKVIWLFYEGNDIFPDIFRESKSKFLMKYLSDNNFEQNLINRQEAINAALSIFLEKKKKEYFLLNNHYLRIIKLNNIRELLMSSRQKMFKNSLNVDNFDGFKELKILESILLNVNQNITSWGGEFYFLYLPSYANLKDNKQNKHKVEIIKILSRLNIKYFDLELEIFNNHENRLSLFPFQLNGHYNKKAYKEIANLISKL